MVCLVWIHSKEGMLGYTHKKLDDINFEDFNFSIELKGMQFMWVTFYNITHSPKLSLIYHQNNLHSDL